jgi:hypothetical protein
LSAANYVAGPERNSTYLSDPTHGWNWKVLGRPHWECGWQMLPLLLSCLINVLP